MTDVIRLNGAPGVGKTTQLFEHVEEEKRAGYGLKDIYYLTFATSGRAESQARLAEVFPSEDADEIRKRAKTFHGAAWVACAINDLWSDSRQQVIDPSSDEEVFERFCTRHGLSYAGDTNPLKAARDGKDIRGNGDALFAINDWLRLTRRSFEDYHLAPTNIPLSRGRVVDLLEAWESFKEQGAHFADDLALYEHGDYVDAAIDMDFRAPASVLFIDEFQDLAPQEYLLYKQWRDSGEYDRIYIAGDPNQSIYSFRAGTPMYFEETDVNTDETRKKSYRCPAEIVSVARGILRSHPGTDPQGFTAARGGGEARELSLRNNSELVSHVVEQARRHDPDGDASVFLLARANYQVHQLAKCLREHGVPYDYLGSKTSAWRDDLPTLLDALRTLARGTGGISVDAAETLFTHSPRGSERRAAAASGRQSTVFSVEAVQSAYSDIGGPEAIARSLDLPDYQRDLLASAVETTAVEKPGDIRVGTIHAAKGLEAPCVLLFKTTTNRINDEYYSGDIAPEEHRIAYVGATRASETLHLVDGYFDGPTSPVFEGGLTSLTSDTPASEVVDS